MYIHFIIKLCIETARLIYTLKCIFCQIGKSNSNTFLLAFHAFSDVSQWKGSCIGKAIDEDSVSDSEHDFHPNLAD